MKLTDSDAQHLAAKTEAVRAWAIRNHGDDRQMLHMFNELSGLVHMITEYKYLDETLRLSLELRDKPKPLVWPFP